MEPSACIPDATGVILAGGRSRRMGQDKAALIWQGRTLFDGVLLALAPLFSAVLIAGNRPDLVRPGVDYCPDRYPGSALGGICTALEAARTPWIFVAPCDLPYPDPVLAQAILARRAGCDAVVPRTPFGAEPVFAAYHKNCLEPMQRLLAAGNCRILDLFPQVRVHYLEGAELPAGWERALINLNSPQDLELLPGRTGLMEQEC